MRSFSPAGMGTKAYFGLGAKTFGNPGGALSGNGAFHGGGPLPGPQLAQLNMFAFLPELGWSAAGIFNSVTSTSKSIMRFSTPASGVNGLATAPDINIPSGDANGMLVVYAMNGFPAMFVAGDASGHIVTSTDGLTWIAANNPSGLAIGNGGPLSGVYDDINNVAIIGITFGASFPTVLTATLVSGTMTFTPVTLTTTTAKQVFSVAYRAGAGITLALLDGGDVYRSSDGGATWTKTATAIFGPFAEDFFGLFYAGVGHGATHNFLAFGGVTGSLLTQSTDDGSTWSATTNWAPLPLVIGPVALAADFAGNLVMETNIGGDQWNVVSHDFGSTWSFPTGVPTFNNGSFGVVWDGTHWNRGAGDMGGAPIPAEFFLTSPDGTNWTQGPNIVD